ncbi:MAG: hypothetical protein ACI9DH_000779 [Halioglobus sp.]|jgi:hypothetical protein
MTRRREDGPASSSQFRTERMFESAGHWYFYTREGSTEGPFESRLDAQERLDVYIEILDLKLLSPDSELSMLDS